MKATPAEVVRELLIAAALVTRPSLRQAWPAYLTNMPDGDGVADDAVCVYDTTPVTEGRVMRGGETIKHPGLQVKVRAKDYRAGWDKTSAIAERFDAVLRATVNLDGFVFLIQSISHGAVLPNGMEESTKRRFIFTLNCQLTISAVQA